MSSSKKSRQVRHTLGGEGNDGDKASFAIDSIPDTVSQVKRLTQKTTPSIAKKPHSAVAHIQFWRGSSGQINEI